MSKPQIRQIEAYLKRVFEGKIDDSDLASKPIEERTKHWLSRAVAALTLQLLANIDPDDAATLVTDGGQDEGIDGLCFSESQQTLFVVQSKWHHQGGGGVGVDDVHKLVTGVELIFEGSPDPFNEKIKALWLQHVAKAMEQPGVKIVVCMSHTGTATFSFDAQRPLDRLASEVNEVSEMLAYRLVTLRDLYAFVSAGAEGTPVNLEIGLADWGQVDQPFRSIYGRLSASEVAEWVRVHSFDRLLSKNIRKVLPNTEINESILDTLTRSPENFWYFNNGLTVLCESLEQRLAGAGNRQAGFFVAKGASIVNGAQTVGAISRLADRSILEKAQVQVRLISLSNCPPDFASSVTRATNTQNKVESRDFAALDPVQQRIRRELLVAGKQYLILRGDAVVDASRQCTVEEAAIALACAYSVELSTIAKNASGRLWDYEPDKSTTGTIYRQVFPEMVEVSLVWNAVVTWRAVESALDVLKRTAKFSHPQICVHGNRFVTHLLFNTVPRDRLFSSSFNVTDFVSAEKVESLVCETGVSLKEAFPKGYVATVFKNQEKCRLLSQLLTRS